MEIRDNNLVISLNDIWTELPADTKADFLQEDGAWEIIQEELAYLQGRSLSTPMFNSSIHKVRELTLTNPEFVSDMLVSFIKTCLEEWATEKQKRYAAERAYWKLYHQIDCDTRERLGIRAKAPLDIRRDANKDTDRISYSPSIHREDVKQEVLEAFGEIIHSFCSNSELSED